MTKVVEYNGMLFPAPMMSGANKFINLGLGYVIKSPYYDTRSQDMFIKHAPGTIILNDGTVIPPNNQ